jgi:hypothetical protein
MLVATPRRPVEAGPGPPDTTTHRRGIYMSDSSTPAQRAPLGVGSIIGDAFSIMLKRFPAVFVLAFVPTVIAILLSGLLVGFGAALGQTEASGTILTNLLSIIVNFITNALITGLLVQLAYDIKLQRPTRYSVYISRAARAAVAIAVLGLVVNILAGLGAIALIVPALWILAVFSVMVPAVVLEEVGFRGLTRSAQLTKDYRWPIVGTILIVAVLVFLLLILVGGVMFMAGNNLLVIFLVSSSVTAIIYGMIGITIALIYARLREIKEGVSVDQIAAVFD